MYTSKIEMQKSWFQKIKHILLIKLIKLKKQELNYNGEGERAQRVSATATRQW